MARAERIKTAGPLARWFLSFTGFHAVTTPWNCIYILAEHEHDPALRAHESCHLDQIARDGPLRFWIMYYGQWFARGYAHIDYEIEARQAAEAARAHASRPEEA